MGADRAGTGEALREAYLAKFMVPVSRRILALSDEVAAVVVAFAPSQGSEVTDYYVPVFTPDPVWPSCLSASPTAPAPGALLAADVAWTALDEFLERADIEWLEQYFEDALAAFLPYVPIGTAGIENLEAFAPYAVVRRTAGEPAVTVVGNVERVVSPLASSTHARVARLVPR